MTFVGPHLEVGRTRIQSRPSPHQVTLRRTLPRLPASLANATFDAQARQLTPARNSRWVSLAAAVWFVGFGVVGCSANQNGTTVFVGTPPMGWSSWNALGCAVTESAVRANADVLVSSGMAALGYQFVNIDDCWMATHRGGDGRLVADPVRFPSGIKAIADYVHGKGLKLGIYAAAGTATCQNLPGSLDHEQIDAASFAEWGVDLLKYDNCNDAGRPARARFEVMAKALAATGRSIIYSVCEWGDSFPWTWARAAGAHSWRTYGDISDNWQSFTSIVDRQVGLESYSGPGGWNDPDMLEIGNGGMTSDEYRAQMSLWALLNAPLIAGNDLRSMSAETRNILTNPAVIAVDQDWSGSQGRRIAVTGLSEVWAKPMKGGGAALVLFNRDAHAVQIIASAASIGLSQSAVYGIRDLWTDDRRISPADISELVPSHGVKMLLVSPP